MTTVYSTDEDLSTNFLKTILQKGFDNEESVSELDDIHNFTDDAFIQKDDVYLSSEDEKYDAPYLRDKNPDVLVKQPINENENILSTDEKKRKATSIQQFSRKRLRNSDQWERNVRK